MIKDIIGSHRDMVTGICHRARVLVIYVLNCIVMLMSRHEMAGCTLSGISIFHQFFCHIAVKS